MLVNILGDNIMEYIVFLLTIQVPFLYLIWKFTQKHRAETNKVLRSLKTQNGHIASFMDTLRMSVEKISEDIYGQGKVNSQMFHIEKKIQDMKIRFHQLELYTGLNTSNQDKKPINPSPALKDKDFS